MSNRRSPGMCPLCGFRVPVPASLDSLWSGAKASGAPAGGGVYVSRCRVCRAGVIAYGDVYDEAGRIVPGTPELHWALRGIPWQTIALLTAILIAIGCLLRWATHPGA